MGSEKIGHMRKTLYFIGGLRHSNFQILPIPIFIDISIYLKGWRASDAFICFRLVYSVSRLVSNIHPPQKNDLPKKGGQIFKNQLT